MRSIAKAAGGGQTEYLRGELDQKAVRLIVNTSCAASAWNGSALAGQGFLLEPALLPASMANGRDSLMARRADATPDQKPI